MFWQKRMNLFRKRVYADAAAATPLSRHAKRALVGALDAFGNPGSLHKEALTAKKILEGARKTIADAIGARADEIIFTASGTEANNLALLGTLGPRLRNGEKLSAITSVIEHQSALAPLRSLEREGLMVKMVDVQQDGVVVPSAVADAMDSNTALVSIQLVNSEMGAIQPAREIGKALRRAKQALFHVDASQAPLWLDLKVERLGVDLMTLDAQKILGPKGIGCLYIKRGTLIDPIIWGGGQERGKRAGTENAPLAAAFAAALKDAQTSPDERAKKVAAARDFLWAQIKEALPDAILHGPALCPKVQPQDTFRMVEGNPQSLQSGRVANNLNISIPGLDGEMAVIAMDAEGVAVSTRSACSTEDEEPSYALLALGVGKKLAKSAIRITLLPDASKKDARRIAQALVEIANRYRT